VLLSFGHLDTKEAARSRTAWLSSRWGKSPFPKKKQEKSELAFKLLLNNLYQQG
jgi:hypothetical protein